MYLFFLHYGKIRKFESIIFHIDRLQKQIVVRVFKKIKIKIEKKEKKIDVKEKKQTSEKKSEEICF